MTEMAVAKQKPEASPATPPATLPTPLSQAEIDKLPPELVALVTEVKQKLGDAIPQAASGKMISPEELEQTVTTAILGRSGTWQELGEHVGQKSKEILDQQYNVPATATEDERIKIIAEGIGKEWQGKIGTAEEYLKKVEGVNDSLKGGLNLPTTATDADLIKAGEKKAAEIVGNSLGLPSGKSIEELQAELKRQQIELLEKRRKE